MQGLTQHYLVTDENFLINPKFFSIRQASKNASSMKNFILIEIFITFPLFPIKNTETFTFFLE